MGGGLFHEGWGIRVARLGVGWRGGAAVKVARPFWVGVLLGTAEKGPRLPDYGRCGGDQGCQTRSGKGAGKVVRLEGGMGVQGGQIAWGW